FMEIVTTKSGHGISWKMERELIQSSFSRVRLQSSSDHFVGSCRPVVFDWPTEKGFRIPFDRAFGCPTDKGSGPPAKKIFGCLLEKGFAPVVDRGVGCPAEACIHGGIANELLGLLELVQSK
ncbi:hypothetical protein KI387_012268, partial [Taxus chinensis]